MACLSKNVQVRKIGVENQLIVNSIHDGPSRDTDVYPEIVRGAFGCY